jgi:hypothetical protein
MSNIVCGKGVRKKKKGARKEVGGEDNSGPINGQSDGD